MYDLSDVQFKVEATQKEIFPAELLLGRNIGCSYSCARKGPSFVWPPMFDHSVIVASDGGHRSDQVNGYGFVICDERGVDIVAAGGGASVGPGTKILEKLRA